MPPNAKTMMEEGKREDKRAGKRLYRDVTRKAGLCALWIDGGGDWACGG